MKSATLNRTDAALREHLLYLLNGDGAHTDFASAVKDLPEALRGKRPQGDAHSAWELLEHMRITQLDVLESIKDASHVSPEFPAGYWPGQAAPADAKAWDKSVKAFQLDFKTIIDLAASDSVDLLTPIAHADGQTVMRKLLMLADHTSYHMGQLVQIRKMLGSWKE
jgi:uncharacterized damage-inducible protein DinB